MFKTAVFSSLLLTVAVSAGTSFGEAQSLESNVHKPARNAETWWSDSWDSRRVRRESRDLSSNSRQPNKL
jgi:hypothetical protein